MKSVEDTMTDVLVFGQLFVDELEQLEQDRSIFREQLKFWASKTIEEFRARVNKLFGNTDGRGKDIARLYDVNYKLLSQLNELNLEEKKVLSDHFMEVVALIVTKAED